MNATKLPSSGPLIASLWFQLNSLANKVYGLTPAAIKERVNSAVSKIEPGPARRPDSGDFVNPPSFTDVSVVKNFARRYIGHPEGRAHAWEELAIFLTRWGWRMSDLAYAQAHRVRADNDIMKEVERGAVELFRANHFKVMYPRIPLIDRKDGGHLLIFPLVKKLDRMHFTPEEAAEFMPFCKAVGRAFQEVMNESGIEVVRLNWMDMGNWRLVPYDDPRFHLHIFGRAAGSRFQIHGEFNQIPPKGSKHYVMIEPINEFEEKKLKERIPVYFAEEMGA
jgi:diadenosine tetraphosphate (Ap4A) HIT family hydrolase